MKAITVSIVFLLIASLFSTQKISARQSVRRGYSRESYTYYRVPRIKQVRLKSEEMVFEKENVVFYLDRGTKKEAYTNYSFLKSEFYKKFPNGFNGTKHVKVRIYKEGFKIYRPPARYPMPIGGFRITTYYCKI